MTTPTAVARAVARDAEHRARAALDTVLAAHTALTDADTALAAATRAKADAGPALAHAITTARAAGITTAQLADLGITTPSERTLRRRRPRPTHAGPGVGTDPHPQPGAGDPPVGPPHDTDGGQPDAHRPGHIPHPDPASPW